MKKLLLLILNMAAFMSLLMLSGPASAQLGSVGLDLVYTPITPCRVLDTRTSQGGTGAIQAAGTKHFTIWGATSYAAQGGSPTNCGITAGAQVAAVAMNFTVVTPAAGGFITAYPFGGAVPVAATVNFQAGDIARGDFTIAKVAQTGTSHLSIFSTSLLDVVGDVVGFYAMPVITPLQVTEVSKFTAVAAGVSGSYTSPTCSAGYYVTGAGYNYTGATSDVWVSQATPALSTNNAICRVFNNSSANITFSCTAICARIGGRL